MNTDTNETPDPNMEPVALTLDKEITEPDWEKVREALKQQGASAETMLEVDDIKELWDTPTQPHVAVSRASGTAKPLVISGWLGEKARYDRTIIAKHKRSGALEAGGFDGKHATGTRKPEFALWLTPE